MSAQFSVQENVSLSGRNTLGIPASARYFVEADSDDALIAAWLWTQEKGLPWRVLGGGSNVVFRENYLGVLLQPRFQTQRFEAGNAPDETICVVDAGASWHRTVMATCEAGWRGLENLSLIPGTVGAAPVQNIGAYGVELKDVLVYVEVWNTETKTRERLSADDCAFAYRDSIFRQHPTRYLILRVAMRLSKTKPFVLSYQGLADVLHPVDELTPDQVADAVAAMRRSKLPDPAKIPNAGSFFKNPYVSLTEWKRLQAMAPDMVGYAEANQVKLAAGWLIERAGWKGFRRGAVGVHDRQALVLVNPGHGSGSELLALAADIVASVRDQFGVELEQEPVVLP